MRTIIINRLTDNIAAFSHGPPSSYIRRVFLSISCLLIDYVTPKVRGFWCRMAPDHADYIFPACVFNVVCLVVQSQRLVPFVVCLFFPSLVAQYRWRTADWPCNKQIKHSQNQNAIWLEIQVVLVGATPPHTINNTPKKGKKFIGLKIYIYKTCLSCIFTMYTVPPVKHSSWKFCIASAVGWVVPFCEGKTGVFFFSVSACVIAWV